MPGGLGRRRRHATTPLLLHGPLTGPAYPRLPRRRAPSPTSTSSSKAKTASQIDLTGNTEIKNGITYSKFETVPDAPVSSFQLELPEKENSILGAVKNLCAPTKTVTSNKKVTVKRHGKKVKVTKKVSNTEPEALIMPTDNDRPERRVPNRKHQIAVTGCKKAAVKKAAKKVTKKGKKKGKKK